MKVIENKVWKDTVKIIWVELPREFEKVYVIPLADCHVGSKFFDEQKLIGYLKWIRDTPEAVCLWNGDLCDCGIPGSIGEWWEQDPVTPQDQIAELVDIVKRFNIEEKTIGVVGGSNHPMRARKLTGHDYDKEFAEKIGLGELYYPDAELFLLKVGHWTQVPIGKTKHQKPPGKQQIPYMLFATHGWSGGRQAGASVNALRELGAIWGHVEVFITAHRHLDSATPDVLLEPDFRHPTINEVRREYVCSGSFLRYGGYALRKGLRPNNPGTPRIRLDGRRKDIHVSI